jgi:predicted dehydrogenase
VVVTPTENHREHAATLIDAGYRVMLERPLTGTLEADRAFAAKLDRDHPDALMLASQRRFDEPLQYAKELLESGAIGRAFKIFSALEDSNPASDGYKSGGILPDMSAHNVGEILWLTGRVPTKALAIGSRVYSHAHNTCVEDFDDALLCLWFGEDLLAQVQGQPKPRLRLSRRDHYFREEGQIHVGHFDRRLTSITVEAYGRRPFGTARVQNVSDARSPAAAAGVCGPFWRCLQSRTCRLHRMLPQRLVLSDNASGRPASARGNLGRYAGPVQPSPCHGSEVDARVK